MKKKVILVDMDGVLCQGESWTPEDCLKAEPLQVNIQKVNKLSKLNFIVVWTARRDDLIPATLKWLRRNDVVFHAVSNNKSPADVYIDDKLIKMEEVM